jgi:predicted transcriptional regulator
MQERTMTKYPTLTIRLSHETLHWLDVEARLQDESKAQIVKQALDLYYRTQHPTD